MRFWDKCTPEPNSGCWLWFGASFAGGYGQFSLVRGKGTKRASRIAKAAELGAAIPSELVIDHLCFTPECVNPAHLEATTQTVNVQRVRWWSEKRIIRLSSITHCPHGHAYTGENTYVYWKNDARMCRTCARERNRARRHA